jgi:excisionase family DNA binding protein
VGPKDAAAYLSISIDVVREMIQKRKIPYVLNGRRYPLDRLDRYIEKIKIEAA